MKLNKKQFRKFILDEVKRIAIQEGWVNNTPSEDEQVNSQLKPEERQGIINSVLNKKGVSMDRRTLEALTDADLVDFDQKPADYASFSLREEKATESTVIKEEESSIEIEDVKILAEEFSRMKELVDFRSPLLSK